MKNMFEPPATPAEQVLNDMWIICVAQSSVFHQQILCNATD